MDAPLLALVVAVVSVVLLLNLLGGDQFLCISTYIYAQAFLVYI